MNHDFKPITGTMKVAGVFGIDEKRMDEICRQVDKACKAAVNDRSTDNMTYKIIGEFTAIANGEKELRLMLFLAGRMDQYHQMGGDIAPEEETCACGCGQKVPRGEGDFMAALAKALAATEDFHRGERQPYQRNSPFGPGSYGRR